MHFLHYVGKYKLVHNSDSLIIFGKYLGTETPYISVCLFNAILMYNIQFGGGRRDLYKETPWKCSNLCNISSSILVVVLVLLEVTKLN